MAISVALELVWSHYLWSEVRSSRLALLRADMCQIVELIVALNLCLLPCCKTMWGLSDLLLSLSRSLLLFLLFWLLADKGWHSSPQQRWDQRAARACNWLLIKCSEPAANSPRRLVICMHSSSAHIQRSKKQQGEGEMKWKVQVNKRTIMWHVQGCNQQLLKNLSIISYHFKHLPKNLCRIFQL